MQLLYCFIIVRVASSLLVKTKGVVVYYHTHTAAKFPDFVFRHPHAPQYTPIKRLR